MSDTTPPIQLCAEDWATVTNLLSALVPTLEVWAFGSRARHTAKPYSDLDLALITKAPLTLDLLARIHDAFESSDLPIRVDLVDWTSTNEAFRQIIQRDKVVVQRVL